MLRPALESFKEQRSHWHVILNQAPFCC